MSWIILLMIILLFLVIWKEATVFDMIIVLLIATFLAGYI